MTWVALLPVIIQYGLPVAEKLWQLFNTNTAPTQADWDSLKIMGQATAKTNMDLALARNNIDPKSPQGIALLALVS